MRLHLQSVALVVFRILCLHAEVSRIAWFAVSFAARTRSPCACAFLCHFAVSVVCLAVSSCLASRPIAPASVPLRYGGTRRQSRHAEDGLGRVLCRGCVHVLPPRSPAARPCFRTVRVSLCPCVCRGSARASVRQAHVPSRPPRFSLFLSALSLLRTRRREGVSAGDVTLARSHSRRPARGHRRVSETQAHGRLSQPESFLWQQGCEPGLRGRAGGRPVAPRTPLSGFPHRRPPLHAPRPPARHRRLLRTAPCPDDRSRPSVTRVLQ